MKTDLFQSWGHCWVFQICWHIECSTSTASSFRIWKSSTGIPSPPLALFLALCKIDSQWEFAVWLRELKPGLNNNLERCGSDVQVGGDMGKPMADLCQCLVETNAVLWSNYPSIKKKKKKEYMERYHQMWSLLKFAFSVSPFICSPVPLLCSCDHIIYVVLYLKFNSFNIQTKIEKFAGLI